MYSLLVFHENQMPLIEYTKTINSIIIASFVVAISNIQKIYNAGVSVLQNSVCKVFS